MRHVKLPLALLVVLLLAGGTYFVAPAPAAQTLGPVTDAIGVVKINKGQPMIIAYWFVITGPNASLGIDTRRGVEIAIEDKKTVAGHSIRLIGEDSGCAPEGGQTAATKLASNRQIVVAIGSNCSSEARAGVPILWKAGLSTVSPSNTAPDLTDAKRSKDWDGYLRTAHNDLVQGRAAAQFVYNALSARRAATIHDGSIYAEQLQQVFSDVFKRLGGTITTQEAINVGDTDMRPVLTKIAATRPDIIYYPIFLPECAFITRQAKEVAGLERVRLMTADGCFSPDYLKGAGESVVGTYLSSPDFGAFAAAYQTFLQKHQRKYGEKPLSVFHAHAYDATLMAFAAIEKVAKKDSAGNTYIGRKALRDALYATRSLQGLTGTITCNQYGDCADPKIAAYQITSGDPAKWDPGTNPKKVWPK